MCTNRPVATPADWLATRLEGADHGLRLMLGQHVLGGAEIEGMARNPMALDVCAELARF
jgi:hypothetical protein